MRTVRFPSDDHALFRDFFYQVKRSGKAALSCPDVMFYIRSMTESDSQLEKFGERWDVGQIIDFDGTKRKILYFRDGPLDKKYLNTNKCGGYLGEKSLTRHPGCRHNLLRFIQYVCKTLSDAGIGYQIDDGTLLGLLKFDNILPWEIDADIAVIAAHKEILKKVVPIWKRDGIGIHDKGAKSQNINLKRHGWTCELWIYRQPRLVSYTKRRTKVSLAGQWLFTVENPGYFMRQRYGREIFRHVEHWRNEGKSTSWYPYEAGKFAQCTKSGHQGCLDKFEADGNIQFREFM